ncbi:hypothetical protein LL912_00810 [Niabella sp. CC-SYL272]|uniref:hypothetical protein n=1 Tax=Niabella agricola TaxID=2891571 RepID=UPI001F445A0A|nr:hypothetical protein [Niabella agricola]MCF3107307.1 hypothetical protein [Niabella agricola]
MAINYSNKNISKKAPAKKMKSTDTNIEVDSLAEVNEIIEYSAKAKAERDKFKENTDANYFTVVTFNNSAQLDEFFNKLGIRLSDKQYIDGKQLAKKLGITIETPDKVAPGAFRISQKLKDMTL